jgi:DNA-binding NarL/FixJ family response regulator
MQMSMSQPVVGSRCLENLKAPVQCKARVPEPTRIGWVSRSRLMRECIINVLASAQPSFELVQFETVADFIEASCKPLDLVIYHSQGRNSADWQELAELQKELAQIKLLIIFDSAAIDPALVRNVLAGGASGLIVTGSNGLDTLVSAIRFVSSGGSFVAREFVMAGSPSKPVSPKPAAHDMPRVTQRERSVLELIKQGRPNKIIARELGISICTVKIHARNLMQKMGVRSRTQLALNADQFFMPSSRK